MNKSSPAPRRVLGVVSIALMAVAATDSLRNLPAMAVYGWSSVTWYLLGTLLFLLPLSLVAAELATGWPVAGGVYAWVRAAFGEQWGFLAVWNEWSENLVWFPSILAFIASTLAYAIDPALANNKVYLLIAMLVIYWILTLINLRGMQATSFFGNIGVVAGTIVPQAMLIVLAIVWVIRGNPTEIAFSPQALVPDIQLNTLPLVATVILMYAGLELVGYHALEAKDPSRDYPRAMFLGAVVIFVLSALGTLAIALVVPLSQLSLAAGLMEAFNDFLVPFGLKGLIPVVALLAALGAMASVSTWLIGPAKGLSAAARRGNLPRFFSRTNQQEVPVNVLMLQGLGTTIVIFLFILVPSINQAYWMLSAMTTQVLAAMYMLLFAAALRLRTKYPDRPRPYRVPGGRWGMRLVAGAGFGATLFALIIGFLPVGQASSLSPIGYVLIMLTGFVLLTIPAFLFYRFRRPQWVQAGNDEQDE